MPLKLDLFKGPRAIVRPLGVIWTPTILFADRRMTVHYRSLNFLPPREFLTILAIGEAEVALRWSQTQQAIDLLRSAWEADPGGALADEALYRLGIATFLLTHSNAAMYEIWDTLRERYPASVWARRIP